MIKVKLNGKKMKTKEGCHLYIKKKLKNQEYHGNNLDALWDVLSSHSDPIEISLKNKDELIEHLGKYGESLIKVFEDVAKENNCVKFRIV